jgi:hypothetical protein
MSPEKGKGALQAPIPKLNLLTTTAVHLPLQPCSHPVTRTERLPDSHLHFARLVSVILLSRLQALGADRRCATCGIKIDNATLGEPERAGALAGRLWCLRHADGGRPQ